MAKFMPNSPPGSLTPVVAKVVRALKALPDEDFIIWHRLSIWEDLGPDFFILTKDQRVALLKVSDASTRDILWVSQPALMPADENGPALGVTEGEALRSFTEKLLTEPGSAELTHIPQLIVFPNLREKKLSQAARLTQKNGIVWVPGEGLKPERLLRGLEKHLSQPLSSDNIQALRKAFTPEVVIPVDFTVRKPIERKVEAELTEYLLDYDQEWLLKCDLDLNDAARRASQDFSVRVINGVAGSGKSLIIVYRALLLRRLFPHKRILVLTHNRPLMRDLAARYAILNEGDDGVEWRTFMTWCMSLYPNQVEIDERISHTEREQLISEVCHDHLGDTAVTPTMLESEIDWFKDQLITRRSEYLMADRTGRGFALQESMRQKIFDAMSDYSGRLEGRGRTDWGGVVKRLWGMIESGEVDPPSYDVILVDEAQFFAPIWFELVKRVLNPQNGHLFLVADPTQGFLKRGQSWLSSGLEVRGRSHRLDRSYRTTLQILGYAVNLYRARVPTDEEEIVVPNLLDMPAGVVPFIVQVSSPQDEITRVVNEISNLIDAGVQKGQILVIHTDWPGVDTIIERLNQKYGPGTAVDPKDEHRRDQIRVCTLNAVTGLESPIVFLIGLNLLYEQEQSLRISDEERVELIRDNTRKIYMAITRAGQRVVITYCGAMPEWLDPTNGRQVRGGT